MATGSERCTMKACNSASGVVQAFFVAAAVAGVGCGSVTVGSLDPKDFGVGGGDVSCDGATSAFTRDVFPLFESEGCSVANCHGKGYSGGGLNLDISDNVSPETFIGVYDALMAGRVNTESVSESILLRKPLGELEHGGGAVIENASAPGYVTIYCWIASGAAKD